MKNKLFGLSGGALALLGVSVLLGAGFTADQALAADAKKPAAEAKGGVPKDYKPWIKICPKLPKDSPKLCVTRADYLDRANLIPYAPIAVEDIEGKGKSIVVTLPHVWMVPAKAKNNKTNEEKDVVARVGARWGILSGVIVKVDKHKEHLLKYVYCDQFGCTAQADATDELIKEMKTGKNILVAGKNNQKTLGLPFTLQGFAEAYDGKPADEEAYKQAWAKQMQNIRAQQIAMMKKQQEAMAAAAKKAEKKK